MEDYQRNYPTGFCWLALDRTSLSFFIVVTMFRYRSSLSLCFAVQQQQTSEIAKLLSPFQPNCIHVPYQSWKITEIFSIMNGFIFAKRPLPVVRILNVASTVPGSESTIRK